MTPDPFIYVAFGDSITFAVNKFGVTNATSFRGRLALALEERLGRKVRAHNAGVGGDITPDALDRVDEAVNSRSPDLVTVMFGVNDAGFYRPATDSFADTPRVELGEFHDSLAAIVDKLQTTGAALVLLTPLPMNKHYWGTDLKPYVENGLNFLAAQYAQAVRDVAAEKHVHVVDTYAYFDSHPDTVDTVPDGIHPDPEGHRTIAELLVPAALEALGL